ncbi:response regulator receiver protein [Rhodoferax koreense]|uniref:Response regulator receiver protein n=1 Tax=Rhodoferax koreensis TaxID=1842727 RepID=A0A1P8JXV8_9BURK|nr:ANTAR domain-containing protein [Rhodoferax koreense]APW38578.1 response regulator receiver protein [Rhodoferax koreense]
MISALVDLHGLEATKGPHPLVADLEAAGIQVLGASIDRSKLVQEVVRHAPDVVICLDPLPSDLLFRTTQAIADTAPCPVIVFTNDAGVEHIARAAESGIHAYVVNGYGAHRLRPLIHIAQARFKRERALQTQLADLANRFEERKMVDRAKGILMHARQVSDDDAFQILRTASMHTNQRLGQVSQQIIHSARFADAVNRAGQLRMLSQRLVKLQLLQIAGAGQQAQPLLQDSVQRIEANIAGLGKTLSKPTFGDLLGQVVRGWGELKAALDPQGGIDARQVMRVDSLAERLLDDAERLTNDLEHAGAAPPLHVLNVVARQRMWSQRYAKYALLGAMGAVGAGGGVAARNQAGLLEARTAFEQALSFLNGIPLTSTGIRASLETGASHWRHMVVATDGLQGGGAAIGQLAAASEGVLDVFEQLTEDYENSMQMLVG